MISNDSQKVRIYITTFEKEMDTRKPKDIANKFICSICLNTNPGDKGKQVQNGKRKSKSYHVCHNAKNYDHNTCCIEKKAGDFEAGNVAEIAAKDVQTSDPNIAQGLNLLNEVLTVFQKNKETNFNMSKTSVLKDAGTSTETNKQIKPKLAISRTVNYCIGEFEKMNRSDNFVIIDYHQPDVIKINNNSFDLIRHKSSSIPQMKLDELKNSIKVKTRSKDTIEEVNRMFATVRKREQCNLDDEDDSNRPITRIGPRVLPVVKTEVSKIDNDKEKIENSCKCCQTFNLSSGDSASGCCGKIEETYEHTVCCRYKKHRNKRKSTVVCECCKCIRNHCDVKNK
ncbi:uncharacterized protein LOC128681651 [Plodia interpunctella]|uniref:uncharacterized protein LOC128681651 n=1 Tax=Plodia interpunctella TaxID=58824 RepID=UPI0023688D0A|nr:uncharacterized protein LOC128681651 [Plodia interpunctella]